MFCRPTRFILKLRAFSRKIYCMVNKQSNEPLRWSGNPADNGNIQPSAYISIQATWYKHLKERTQNSLFNYHPSM